MASTAKTVRVNVTGRVQGVYFRAWTQEKAQALRLKGWVRNEPDGSVAALISGPQAAVDEMIEALWEGSPPAEVTDVAVEPAETDADLGDFRIV